MRACWKPNQRIWQPLVPKIYWAHSFPGNQDRSQRLKDKVRTLLFLLPFCMGPIHPDGWHNSCICKLGKFGKLDILYVGKRLRRESGMMLHELSCFDL